MREASPAKTRIRTTMETPDPIASGILAFESRLTKGSKGKLIKRASATGRTKSAEK
jgi:hypothetical protein